MGGWNLKTSKWANPVNLKQYSLEDSLYLYECHLLQNLIKDIDELKGKLLGCWCKPAKCHGDILFKYTLLDKLEMGRRRKLLTGVKDLAKIKEIINGF